MRVIQARNVHQALVLGVEELARIGQPRSSRGGDVLVHPEPVTTVYERPTERVVFWAERDANPFFHLYESLWMLAGRNDVAPLLRYAKNMENYADDGVMHGAYGERWRKHFLLSNNEPYEWNQLAIIADRLKKDPTDRRSVLGMWDPETDLGANKKDLPCNTMATFQINSSGKLDLTVFCRSNDIIWGAYGANAVHFSILLEYMALWIGVPVGVYNQVSVNWHAYREVFDPLAKELDLRPWLFGTPRPMWDPYVSEEVRVVPMTGSIEDLDREISEILYDMDNETISQSKPGSEFGWMCYRVLKAHELYRQNPAPLRYDAALQMLGAQTDDWTMAASQWITRRRAAWERKMQNGNPEQA